MDLKEFEKLLKICRKQGVNDLVFKDISIKFGELPIDKKDQSEEYSGDIPSDGLSDDELMFYHLQGGGKE